MTIKFILKDGGKLPVRGSKYAAGLDIHCLDEVYLQQGERKLIHTGVYLADCYESTYLRVAPRSKLAHKYGIDVMAGVVDSDYRGEICVILRNTSKQEVHLPTGSAIAQLIQEALYLSQAVETTEAEETERGTAGIQDKDLRL